MSHSHESNSKSFAVEFTAMYNRLQEQRNELISIAASSLLRAETSLGSMWFETCLGISRLHFLLQWQQTTAEKNDMLAPAVLASWRLQRRDDFNHGLIVCFDVARDIMAALDAKRERVVLGSIPIAVLHLKNVLGERLCHEELVHVLRQHCLDVQRSVKVVLGPRVKDLSFGELDEVTMDALLNVESRMASIRRMLAGADTSIRGSLVRIEAELIFQRVLRAFWMSETNQFRTQDPEFYRRMSIELLSPAWIREPPGQ